MGVACRFLGLLMRTVLVRVFVSACVRMRVSASISVGGVSGIERRKLLLRACVTSRKGLGVLCAFAFTCRDLWRVTLLCFVGRGRVAVMAIGVLILHGRPFLCMAGGSLCALGIGWWIVSVRTMLPRGGFGRRL